MCIRDRADAEQRAHADLLHRLLVEDLDLDAELFELGGTVGELLGIEHVRRLVHEVASLDDAGGDSLRRLDRLLDRGRVERAQRYRQRLGFILILALGLVAIEGIGCLLYTSRCV